jgi:hypothetical protein
MPLYRATIDVLVEADSFGDALDVVYDAMDIAAEETGGRIEDWQYAQVAFEPTFDKSTDLALPSRMTVPEAVILFASYADRWNDENGQFGVGS